MFDRYNLNMSRQQQRLLMAWDKQFPVTPWEKERNNRITAIMGHPSPFVTKERSWTQGYKPVGDGVVIGITAKSAQSPKQQPHHALSQPGTSLAIVKATFTIYLKVAQATTRCPRRTR